VLPYLLKIFFPMLFRFLRRRSPHFVFAPACGSVLFFTGPFPFFPLPITPLCCGFPPLESLFCCRSPRAFHYSGYWLNYAYHPFFLVTSPSLFSRECFSPFFWPQVVPVPAFFLWSPRLQVDLCLFFAFGFARCLTFLYPFLGIFWWEFWLPCIFFPCFLLCLTVGEVGGATSPASGQVGLWRPFRPLLVLSFSAPPVLLPNCPVVWFPFSFRRFPPPVAHIRTLVCLPFLFATFYPCEEVPFVHLGFPLFSAFAANSRSPQALTFPVCRSVYP